MELTSPSTKSQVSSFPERLICLPTDPFAAGLRVVALRVVVLLVLAHHRDERELDELASGFRTDLGRRYICYFHRYSKIILIYMVNQ